MAVFIVVHYLNDFSRVQNAGIGSTAAAPGALSRVVITNESSKKIAFDLRCDSARRRPNKPSDAMVLLPRESMDFDVHPDLAGRELPRIIESKTCEATWRGPLGISCRAWQVRWQYGKPAHKGVMMADEDGACRIATCYSTSRLSMVPSCLSAVYLSRRERGRTP